MAFSNPITGGQGALLRPAIKSPDYVAGVSGWTINRDGSAEFADLTIRSSDGSGNVIVLSDGEINVYDSGGHLVASFGPDGYRLYSVGSPGSIVARVVQDGDTGYDAGFFTRDFSSPHNLYALLSGSTLSFGTFIAGNVDSNGQVTFQRVGGGSGYTALNIFSGGLNTGDSNAIVQVRGQAGSAAPKVFVADTGTTQCDLDVTGVVTSGSEIFGNVSITPSAANTPTSTTVTYALKGSTFRGFATANTVNPGTTGAGTGVTGVSMTSVASTSALLWVNRQNTTSTNVYWMVKSI